MFKYLSVILMTAIAGCAVTPNAGTKDGIAREDNPQAVQVMILGTYHMAGSTSDLINVETQSVLTPRRQQELEELASALARFDPNVVVTERVTDAPDFIDPKFAEFSDQTLAENENERAQVAYRLAQNIGITRVYGIDEQPSSDEPDYFPFGKVMAHAQASGQGDKISEFLANAQSMVEEFTEKTKDDHIAEKLYKLNTGPMSAADFYYGLSDFDLGEDQPGAELQAYWFMRNAKIWSKLMDVTGPGDRVVVVYGAGHKYWLEHMADHTDGYVRINPSPYLLKALE